MNNYTNNTSNADEIDFGRTFRSILLQSKLVLIITVLGLILGISYFMFSTKNYKISSMLQVYTNNTSPLNTSSSDFIFTSSSANDVSLLVTLYKSRSNIINIIENFNLNVFIQDPIDIKINTFKIEGLLPNDSRKLFLKFYENNYEIYDANKELIEIGNYNESLESNYKINIERPKDFKDIYYEILYLDPSFLYPIYAQKIQLEAIESNNFTSSEGLIKVSYVTSDVVKGQSIINFANKIFLDNGIRFEKQKARKAIDFIDSQLTSISSILESNKTNLKDFKEQNKSLDVDLEIKSIIDTIAKIDETLNLIDIEYAEAASIYTTTNPILLNIIERKEVLQDQKKEIEIKIQNLPFAQQRYIDLYRDVEVSQQLYADLMNRKLSFSILEASSLGNIRVVDNAYTDIQVSPRFLYVLIITFLSFVIGIVIALIRASFFLSVTNPAEINDNGINTKIYGVIPNVNEKDPFDDISFSRSVESMILNLNSTLEISEKGRVIVLTSPTENNGKSLMSRSLSIKLAEMGHKTLLIDNDLIRGDQHKFLNIKKIKSDSFHSIDYSNIEKFKINDNFFAIPKISGLTDTFNFLYSDAYNDKINFFKEIFEYIIIDTSPALSVSDTSILMSFADLNFLVVRHNITKINQIKQTWYMSEQIDKEFDGIIYNAYSKPNSYYGYYGVYGDYRYQYYAEKYLYNYKYSNEEDL